MTDSKKTLKSFSLYEKQDTVKLTDFEKQVLTSQEYELKRKKTWIDLYSQELVFYDLFMKNQVINWKKLDLFIEWKKASLSKHFKNEFYNIDTPNEKNYEKLLIEKLTDKIIIDTIKNSYSWQDKIDIDSIEKNLELLEDLKEEYRKIWYEYIEDKKCQEQTVKEYRKARKNLTDKNLKAKYRLCKKYKYLID